MCIGPHETRSQRSAHASQPYIAKTLYSTQRQTPQPRLTRKDYTVGWVCALPIELAAAQEMLDEDYQGLSQDADDFNIYILGRMGEHNVVIASLPAGQMGNNSAASVAVQMTGFLNAPPTILLNAIASLRVKQLRRRVGLLSHLSRLRR